MVDRQFTETCCLICIKQKSGNPNGTVQKGEAVFQGQGGFIGKNMINGKLGGYAPGIVLLEKPAVRVFTADVEHIATEAVFNGNTRSGHNVRSFAGVPVKFGIHGKTIVFRNG